MRKVFPGARELYFGGSHQVRPLFLERAGPQPHRETIVNSRVGGDFELPFLSKAALSSAID